MKDRLIISSFLIIGFSRMTILSGVPDYLFTWMTTIAPRPKVFVNENYFESNRTRFILKNGSFLDIDFNLKAQWPFQSDLLLSYYPLLRILDRSRQVDSFVWNHYINYFICQKKGQVFKPQFPLSEIVGVEAYHYSKSRSQWQKVQSWQCL